MVRDQSTREREQMQMGKLGRLGTLYMAATAAGWIFMWLGLPLPWMIGPMVLTASLTFSGLSSIVVPVVTRPLGQAIVACQVGLTFTPAAFAALGQHMPLLIGMALLICLAAVLAALALSRFGGIPLSNALLALLPTSPVEASVTAERYGFDPAPIILAQTIRITTVVIVVPLTLFMLEDPYGTVAARATPAFDLVTFILLAGLAVAGALLFRKLRVGNPNFMGPLTIVVALNLMGALLLPFPDWMLQMAQIILGTWLGSTFRRSLFVSAGRYVAAAVSCSLLFVLFCAISGLLMAATMHMPFDLMLMASAPAGVTEMALTAKVLGADVALVTAFHLTRLFIIMPNITWFVDAVDRMERRRRGD